MIAVGVAYGELIGPVALRVARRYGCVPDSVLPMDGGLSPLRTGAFYTMAAKYRIASYHNLRRNRAAWRRWLSNQGPILAPVEVDGTWRQATRTHGELAVFRPDEEEGGGHAICSPQLPAVHSCV